MSKKFYFSLALLLPLSAFAQSYVVDDLFSHVMSILEVISGLLSGFAFAFFFWSLIKFIRDSRDGKTDLKKGKDMLIWSGVALFMMVGIWTVVGYVQESIGDNIATSDITQTPMIPGSVD